MAFKAQKDQIMEGVTNEWISDYKAKQKCKVIGRIIDTQLEGPQDEEGSLAKWVKCSCDLRHRWKWLTKANNIQAQDTVLNLFAHKKKRRENPIPDQDTLVMSRR